MIGFDHKWWYFITQEITVKDHCSLAALSLLRITSSHPTACAPCNSRSTRSFWSWHAEELDGCCLQCGASHLSWGEMPSATTFLHGLWFPSWYILFFFFFFKSKHNLVRSKLLALLSWQALFFLYTQQMRAVYLTTVLHNKIKQWVWRMGEHFRLTA